MELEDPGDRTLAFVTDWTVFVRAAAWRSREEERIRAEDPNIPPAPRTVKEIREERVRQMAAFEEMQRKIGRG